jgi:hypothetical protein
LSGGLVEDGSHHLAWPTPGSPEIYNDRDSIARNILFKIGAGQFNGSCNEQFVFASSAFGAVPQASAFYAVGSAAMGANNLHLFVHGFPLRLFLFYGSCRDAIKKNDTLIIKQLILPCQEGDKT